MISLVAVYITANVSGGHLNPAVTFATCLTGHTSWAKGGLYVIAQVMGGIFGSLMGVSQLAHLWLHLCQCMYLAINVMFCTRLTISLKVFLFGTAAMLTLACTHELDCAQAALCLASLSHSAVACAAMGVNLIGLC